MASNKNLYGGYSKNSVGQNTGYLNGVSQPISPDSPSDARFNPYDFIHQYNYESGKRGQAQYAEDLARLQYLADLAQQDWQNAYNEARVADERAYQEKITADNRAYNERMIAEDREYNSYANQVSLMRQAGLNPDLLGVSLGNSQTPIASGQSVGSNSSVSGPNVGSNPMTGMPTNLDTFGNVVSIIGSVASTAMSLYSGGLSIVGQSLGNMASATQAIGNTLNTFDSAQGSFLSNIISSSFLTRGQQRKLKKFYNSYVDTPRFEMSKNDFNVKQLYSHANSKKAEINPFLTGDDWNNDGIISNEDWSEVWKPIFEAQYKLAKETLSNDRKEQENRTSDLDHMKSLREPFREVIQNMYNKYKDGQDFWGYALSALYMLLNIKGVSFNSSSSPKGSKSSFNFGIK